jgi:hypothetical protein
MFMLVRVGVGVSEQVQVMLRSDKSSDATLDHLDYVGKGSWMWSFAEAEGRPVRSFFFSTTAPPRLLDFCPSVSALQNLPFAAHAWSTTSTISA